MHITQPQAFDILFLSILIGGCIVVWRTLGRGAPGWVSALVWGAVFAAPWVLVGDQLMSSAMKLWN